MPIDLKTEHAPETHKILETCKSKCGASRTSRDLGAHEMRKENELPILLISIQPLIRLILLS
jgi:hypothetical protein